MQILKLAPFIGVALAQSDYGDRRADFSQNQEIFYRLPETALRYAYSNFNASGRTDAESVDVIRTTNSSTSFGRSWELELRVSAHVSLNEAEEVAEDNQVTQFTSFSFTNTSGYNNTDYNQGLCFTFLEGLSEELTERANNDETQGTCSFIPSECTDDLSHLSWETTTDDDCDPFDLPQSCRDAFPNGRISRFHAETEDLRLGDGYLFAHASEPQERNSENATTDYETALRRVWYIMTTSHRNIDGRPVMPIGSSTCLKISGYEDDSENPFETEENSDDDDDGNGSNGSGASTMKISLLGLFVATGLAALMV